MLDRNLLQCVAAFVGHDSGAFAQTLPRPIHYLDPLGRRVDIGLISHVYEVTQTPVLVRHKILDTTSQRMPDTIRNQQETVRPG